MTLALPCCSEQPGYLLPDGFHVPRGQVGETCGAALGEDLNVGARLARVDEIAEQPFTVVGEDFYDGLVDQDAQRDRAVSGRQRRRVHERQEIRQAGRGLTGVRAV